MSGGVLPRAIRWVTIALIRGGTRYQPVASDRPVTSIGRDLRCDIAFGDESAQISRRHAEVRVSPRGVTFRDCGSSNGTFLGGERVGEIQLADGKEYVFSLGSAELSDGIAIVAMYRPDHPAAPQRTIMEPRWEQLSRRASMSRLSVSSPAPAAAAPAPAPSVPGSTPVPAARAPRATVEVPVPAPEKRPYHVAHVLHGARRPDQCYEPALRGELERVSLHVFSEEAPISLDLLARRIAPYWRIARSSEKLRQAARDCLTAQGAAIIDGFAWLPDQTADRDQLTFFRVPTADERSRRAPGDIPVEELAAAALYCLAPGALEEATLVRRTAELLGFSRLGANVKARMASVIPFLTRKQLVTVVGGFVSRT